MPQVQCPLCRKKLALHPAVGARKPVCDFPNIAVISMGYTGCARLPIDCMRRLPPRPPHTTSTEWKLHRIRSVHHQGQPLGIFRLSKAGKDSAAETPQIV